MSMRWSEIEISFPVAQNKFAKRMRTCYIARRFAILIHNPHFFAGQGRCGRAYLINRGMPVFAEAQRLLFLLATRKLPWLPSTSIRSIMPDLLRDAASQFG